MRLIFSVAALCVLPLAADDIAKHPRELQYTPRFYQPPRAADHRHAVAGGAVAFLVEDHLLPLIHVAVTVRTGAYLEPPDKTGLASLTGGQMRAGGAGSKSPAEFDEEAAFLAAQIGSSIGDVSGQASVDCLTKDIDACLALFVEMLRQPAFAEDRLKLAKNQALQAMERRNDSTASIEAREFPRLMRGADHFTARQMTRASLESITRDDLVAFHRNYYYPANFVLAVSGDFKTSTMLDKLNLALGNWPSPRKIVPPPPPPRAAPKPGVYVVDKKEVNQGRVRMGHPGVTFENPDHLALALLNGILGGNEFSSRITARVRSDEGLAYSAASVFQAGNFYPGLFQAMFQSKSATVAQAAALIQEEMVRLQTEKVKPDELETAISRAVESLPDRFETARATAGQFADDAYLKMPEDYWQKYTARVKAVTADEILRVARQYLKPGQLVILVVGNEEAVVKGNPDRPQYSLEKLGTITRIPLPDPVTLDYPKE